VLAKGAAVVGRPATTYTSVARVEPCTTVLNSEEAYRLPSKGEASMNLPPTTPERLTAVVLG
jgi:hypothetical protein